MKEEEAPSRRDGNSKDAETPNKARRKRRAPARTNHCGALPTDRLWTEQDSATYLRVSRRSVRDLDIPRVLLRGRGEGVRYIVRYEPSEVMAYARRRKTHSIRTEDS